MVLLLMIPVEIIVVGCEVAGCLNVATEDDEVIKIINIMKHFIINWLCLRILHSHISLTADYIRNFLILSSAFAG